MKKKSLAAAFLAAIVSCLLFGCGNGTVKNSESAESAPVNALLKAGAYRGTLSLNAELGLRLDAEDLSAGYAELVDPDGQRGVPVITRQMELSVAEDLRTGRLSANRRRRRNLPAPERAFPFLKTATGEVRFPAMLSWVFLRTLLPLFRFREDRRLLRIWKDRRLFHRWKAAFSARRN